MINHEAAEQSGADEILLLKKQNKELQLQLQFLLEQNQHQYYNNLLADNTSLILIHWIPKNKGKMLYTSKNWYALLGYSPASASFLSAFIQKEDYTRLVIAAHTLKEHPVLTVGQLQIPKADGTYLLFSCQLQEHQSKDGSCIALLQCIHDQDTSGGASQLSGSDAAVSEAKARELDERKSLEQTLQLTQLSIENASEAIFWVDQASRIIKANKAACTLTQYSDQELLRMHVQDIAVKINNIEWLNFWQRTQKAGTYIAEAYLQAKGGRTHITEVVANFFEYERKGYLFILVRDISSRKLAEEQLMTSLNEKEILLAEIHHRVKNNMAVISSLLSLQASYTEDQSVKILFQESCNRIKSMSLIHEKLYQSETFSRINYKEYINDLISHIRKANYSTQKHIHIQLDIEEVYMDIVTAVPCGLLLNELVTNAYKHAFEGRDSGIISISLYRKSGKFNLTVKDNGVGLSQNKSANGNSLGLMLIHALSAQLNAVIEESHDQGTAFNLVFEELKNKISKIKQPI